MTRRHIDRRIEAAHAGQIKKRFDSHRIRGTPVQPFSAMASIAAIFHSIEEVGLWGVGLSHDGGLMGIPKKVWHG
jgi:hypothetical protein